MRIFTVTTHKKIRIYDMKKYIKPSKVSKDTKYINQKPLHFYFKCDVNLKNRYGKNRAKSTKIPNKNTV